MIIIIYLLYIILGIIQGITEPIPISSSGHLFIFKKLLNININSLEIEIFSNFGSFLAISIFYIKDIKNIVFDLLKFEFNLISKLIIGIIPIGILTLLFYEKLENLNNIKFISISLFITSIILFFSHKLVKINTIKEITYLDSFYIGIFQSLAIFPGISRSGITTFGGLINKKRFDESLKFSFLLYLPVSLLSLIYLLLKTNITLELSLIFILIITSFIFTYLSLKLFFKLVRNNKLIWFSLYCLILGILIILLS